MLEMVSFVESWKRTVTLGTFDFKAHVECRHLF
jgi:hypothetical protein